MWQYKDTAGVFLLINGIGTVLTYSDPIVSWLDWVSAISAPVGVVTALMLLRKYGIPTWLKELVIWFSFIAGVSALGHYLEGVR